MLRSPLVLDNNVLSSFVDSGWFDALSFPIPTYDVVTPRAVWGREFEPYVEMNTPPEWLELRTFEEELDSPTPGQLSDLDWQCLGLAEESNGTVITNDKPLREQCLERGVETRWGTKFMLRIFKGCAITQSDYDAGLGRYLEDVYLPASVEDELRSQEK